MVKLFFLIFLIILRFIKIFYFITICLLGLSLCTANTIPSFVTSIIEGNGSIPSIDSYPNTSYSLNDGTYRSMYHYQSTCMALALYAFRSNNESLKYSILKGLNLLNGRLKSLSDLRIHASFYNKIDSYFTDSLFTGTNDKQIFCYVNEDNPTSIHHHDITTNQITAYIAFTLCLFSEEKKILPSSNLYNLLNYLVIDYLWMHSTEIYAWHWNGNFKNKLDRLNYKLLDPSKQLKFTKRYHSAILDSEWWFFAIAGYTKTIIKNLNFEHKFHKKYLENIDYILKLAKQVFNKRLTFNEYFYFDSGRWSDREQGDYAWQSYTKEIFPAINTPPSPTPDVMLDTAHFHRMPWVLLALRDSDLNNFDFYERLLKRLADHFIEKVLFYDKKFNFPLVSTFFDGSNGWYKFNFKEKWGFRPGSGSYSLMDCSWLLLLNYNNNISKVYTKLQEAMSSDKDSVVNFRTKYYGKINHPFNGKFLLHGDLDISDTNSLNYFRVNALNNFINKELNIDVYFNKTILGENFIYIDSDTKISSILELLNESIVKDKVEGSNILVLSKNVNYDISKCRLTIFTELHKKFINFTINDFKRSIFKCCPNNIGNNKKSVLPWFGNNKKNILPWFGNFLELNDNWFFLNELNYFYCNNIASPEFWLWSNIFDWIYVSKDSAPFFFMNNNSSWCYYNYNNRKVYTYDKKNLQWKKFHQN